jgi:hypothetical protein
MNQIARPTFKGERSVYTVVAAQGHVQWGVSIRLEAQKVTVRFSTLGQLPAPPKHFNFRMPGGFLAANGEVQPGLYFDKVGIPIVAGLMAGPDFSKICADFMVADIVGEWIARQFQQEGITLDVPAEYFSEQLQALIVQASAPSESMVVFEPPKDIWHEPKISGVQESDDD